MEHIFWLKEGKIAGRSGPNTNAWDLEEIKANGFAAVLSVNNGDAVHETLLAELGIAYACIPMSSNAPAREGDKEFCLRNIPKALAFIQEALTTGPVLIHCRSGKDRTGMIMAAWLMESEEIDAHQAMEKVSSVRPIAFSAAGWMEFGLEVLGCYETRRKASLLAGSHDDDG